MGKREIQEMLGLEGRLDLLDQSAQRQNQGSQEKGKRR